MPAACSGAVCLLARQRGRGRLEDSALLCSQLLFHKLTAKAAREEQEVFRLVPTPKFYCFYFRYLFLLIDLFFSYIGWRAH